MEKINIKYFSEDYEEIEKIDGDKSDWIDLRVDRLIKHNDKLECCQCHECINKPIKYKKGDVLFLGLGVAMELPKGYEAYVVPRSSMFKNTGFLLTDGIGIIDNAFAGNDDEWKAMVYCTRDGEIKRHDRLFQFRITKNQPEISFQKVDKLIGENRGGYGSTGRR